ncbi:MAG: cupin domain-containing protein [Candidatus Nanopelagicales bacterium]
MSDHGLQPFVVDIEEATVQNETFRTALWTGEALQLTVMSIPPGEDIGLEIHGHGDQFLRVEAGRCRVQMGQEADDLSFDQTVEHDWAVLVPGGWWHNVTNVGEEPLKVYSIYAPPEHAHGTVHATKADDDHHHHH